MLRQALCLCLHFLPFFAPFKLTRADYIMDDTNSSITYLPSKSSGSWAASGSGDYWDIDLLNGTTANIDYNQLYNKTFTFSICNPGDNCQIMIPFTGSGITIYAVQLDISINYTIHLDDVRQKLPKKFPTLPDGHDFAYNVTLYDNQSLSFGYHNLVLNNTGTLLMFDSANIKEPEPTTVSNTSAPSTASSSSPSSSSEDMSHKLSHVGAIAGGVAGGLIALGVIGSAIAVIFSRRRRNQWTPSSEYGEHNTQLLDVPPQSLPVPPMIQENHHSAYGVGAQARPRRYDPSDPNTYPTSSTPATGYTSSSRLAPRSPRSSYNYIPEI